MNFSIQNQKVPQKDFAKIANDLMNRNVLIVGKSRYRLTELEFYYFNAQMHPDPYVHKDDMQLQIGKCYFHGSGLDITFGDGQNHGGILIRAIAKVVNGKVSEDKLDYTYGPLSLLKELFKNFETIEAQKKDFGLAAPFPGEIPMEDVISTTRVGLNSSKDNGEKFYDKHYRFLVMPKMEHKEKEKIREQLIEKGMTKSEFKNLFGW
jgi:3-methyladenine DNA glycosylase Mpg